MKKVLFALMCILTISIGFTATGAPIDTSPDIECVIVPSVDIDNTFTSVIDHPFFAPVNMVCASTSIEETSFRAVVLPNYEDPVPLNVLTDKPIGKTTLNAPNLDPTAGASAECSANLNVLTDKPIGKTTLNAPNLDPTAGASAECSANLFYTANKFTKAKRKNYRRKNKSTFPGTKAPRTKCDAYN